MSADLDYLTATALRRLITTRQVSPVELASRALDRATATQTTLNAFCLLMPEKAMAEARAAEAAVMRGDPLGALHGLPISVKDLIAIADEPQAFGSRTMAASIAAADAPAVERVRKAGAVIIGKTTTSEFGCKPVGDSPLTGITRNPWNLACTAGGSSAGAAASVAAGVTALALGTDGGGSIRIPAALCGLSGLKGSFGRVPVWPTSATPTLAHVGPIARTIEDAALLFSAIAGHDTRDPFAIAGPVPDVLAACARPNLTGLRIAWSPTLGYARPTAEVTGIVAAAVAKFETFGAHVELVDRVFESDPAPLWTAEFYAGVGTRLRPFLEANRELLDPAVADILESALGQDMRSYYQSVFARYALREQMRLFFERYDLLVSPTLPISSVAIGRDIPDGYDDRNLLSWVYYTYPFNLTGQPAATVCAGFAPDDMPVGMQIVGRMLCEANVVAAAAAFESIPFDWRKRRPLIA